MTVNLIFHKHLEQVFGSKAKALTPNTAKTLQELWELAYEYGHEHGAHDMLTEVRKTETRRDSIPKFQVTQHRDPVEQLEAKIRAAGGLGWIDKP